MSDHYNNYKNSVNENKKIKEIKSFSDIVFSFIHTFDKEGNDTLGNKYFLYIKILFTSYKETLKIAKDIENDYKNKIINNSKELLEKLSNFKNISGNNYIELLRIFDIKSKYKEILYDLAVYTMELLFNKAEKIINSKNFNFYIYKSSKYLLGICIKISEIFIKSYIHSIDIIDIQKRYFYCIKNSKEELIKMQTIEMAEITYLKKEGELFNNKDIDRDKLLIILDCYNEILKNNKKLNDLESEAIYLANIVKIKYKFLKYNNFNSLKEIAEKSINCANRLIKDIKKEKWFIEISEIFQELSRKTQQSENLILENEDNIKNDIDEIKEYRKKSDIEFIKFILSKYPTEKSPLKPNQTVEEQFDSNKYDFITRLLAKYSPINLNNDTQEEKKNIRYIIIYSKN